ncbi:MAG: hypothetical protein GXY70_00045 [Euryarchaeota archaeon]|nr:hypothetical protein [Euryarchaeota archaeon]
MLLAILMIMSTVIVVVAPDEVGAARVSPIRTTNGWALEVVDGDEDTGWSTSLAIDDLGHNHIAYAQYNDYTVYYATDSSGTWEIESLNDMVDVEQEISLAVDADGHAHVLYMRYYDEFENLTYATNAGGSWESMVIGPKVSGLYNDIFIDGSGVIHIAYTVSDTSWNNNVLMYANNSGGVWNTPVLVDENGEDVGWHCSIEVNENGYIYIVYQVRSGTDHFLRMAQKAPGMGWSPASLDFTAGDDELGYFASIATFGDEIHVSHYDGGSFDLIYKHFDGVAWEASQIVDGDEEVGEFSSIGVDSKGVPHIAYYDSSHGVLKFAEMIGTEWNVSVVDGLPTTGYYCSLAMAPDDRVRISYHDDKEYDLCLASEDVWITDMVHPGALVGERSALALDKDGNVYIAYCDYMNRDLWFATNAGGSWATELVESAGDVAARLSMDIDDGRNVHISYLERANETNKVGYLKYATNAGGNWTTEVLAQIAVSYSQTSSLKVDPAGNVHIFFYNGTDDAQDLWYATNSGGSWQVSLFEECMIDYYYVGTENSLFIDANGDMHLTYRRAHRFGADQRSDVVYANNVGGTWTFDIAASGRLFGQGTSLAVDADGKAHVAFREMGNFSLVYATNAGGSWTNRTLAPNVGESASLAVDSKGAVSICFLSSTDKWIRYANNADGRWSFINVASAGTTVETPSMALDSGGMAHISYYEATGGRDGLKYVTNSAWKITTVFESQGLGNFAPGYTSMKVDAKGWAHVCYYDTVNTSLMYATNTGGTWVHTLVDGAGSVQAGNFNSLVLDSNGKVHISYLDSVNGRLKYATNADRGWKNVTLDGHVGVSSVTDIAVDGNDVVYISYHASSKGDLRCARNAGGTWEYCTVDNSTNDVGSYSSIAIEKLTRTTYRPHISYYDTTGGDLKYAVYKSGAWGESVWDISNINAPAFNVGMHNSMVLDGYGMAHVSYYDTTNDRLLLSINTGAFWNTVTIDIHAGLYTSMAMSDSGVMYIAYYDNNDDDLKIAINHQGDNLVDGGWGVATVDCAGDVGRYISLDTGTQSTVHISYVDYTGEAVKHAQLRAEPSAPFGLAAVASDDDVTLSWSAPQMNNGCAITGYVLQRTDLADSRVDLIEVGNALGYVDAGLSDGNYSYKVAALNSMGASVYSLKADVTVDTLVITVPGAPTNVVANPGDGTVEISWDAPLNDGGSPITGYMVYRGDVGGNLTALITLGVQLNYTDLGLENGHTYHYAVTALNSIGESSRSAEATATPATVPSAPRNLTATLDGNDVILTWEAPEGDGGSPILNYTIYSGTISGDLEYLYRVGDLLTYTDTMSLPSTTFYYQVTATNALGEGPRSNEASSDPDLPTSPSLSGEADGDAVVLTWTTPASSGSSAVTNYKVYRGNTSGALTMIAELGNVLTYQDDDVVPGATYFYKVTAVNDQGEGPFSNEVSVMTGSAPSAPRNLQATTGNATVTLTWEAPETDGGWDITGYKVYRGTSEGSETLLITLGDVTTYTDSAVVNDQTYYYRVSAVNDVGEGPLTSSEDATPTADGGSGGDDEDNGGGDNTMLYIVIAIIAGAVCAAVAVFLLKKKK